MPNRLLRLSLIALVTLVGPVAAQQPLSAIDWLGKAPTEGLSSPVLLEPPITETAMQPRIDVTPLEKRAPAVGLAPPDVTGFPADLWSHSRAATLERLIGEVSVRNSPAMQSLFYTLLLAANAPPQDGEEAEKLLLARIDRLFELGAVEPSQELVRLAGPADSPARFSRWFDATLLTGDEDQSCRVLIRKPFLAPDYAARIFCSVRQGDWATAVLLLESAHALDLLPTEQLNLLDRFLSPDVYDGAPPLPAPSHPDPLTFRLLESIGEPQPTASLPRAFATADLRDIAGWKAQVEAAERLARIGALDPNHLLGLYTARKPAASGGVWDRVAALQKFETALESGSTDAVAKTLPPVWAAMRAARLEVPFATLFGNRLAMLDLENPVARDLAWRIRLLDPDGKAAGPPPDLEPMNRFLAALAQGKPQAVPAPNALARTIQDGYSQSARPPDTIDRNLSDAKVGEAMLRAMILFENGMHGDPDNLSAALVSLRAIGLEETARQGALELMLLERS